MTVDSRGTGASFGSRPIDFAPSEIHDLSGIHDWVKKQFWSNGKIAAGGFSYDGMAGKWKPEIVRLVALYIWEEILYSDLVSTHAYL